MSILSKYYSVEIAAVSIQTARIDLFGEGVGYSQRIFVIYDGIHYDVMVKNHSENSNEAADVSVFSVNDMNTYEEVIRYAQELKANKKFTDINTFTLMCSDCSVGLVGEQAAIIHAQQTGHTNFSEYLR